MRNTSNFIRKVSLIGASLFFLLSGISNVSASADSPYPVIFIHGLNSDDQTWDATITQLSNSWTTSSQHVLHAVLNARGGDTTFYFTDVIFPLLDQSGNPVNTISPSNIYRVNFGNFWNRDASDPRIILYSNSLPGSSQSPSNQSAIYKQGYALSIVIDSVLRVTGADKVILAGHSMGGLAIREYLQRRESGVPKWWVEPWDTLNGHRVAKVVTTGTPHLGTNTTSIPLLTIDNNSEAMRDMRFSYTNGQTAAYLFSNSELNVTTNFYNRDINCNNSTGEDIMGLSQSNTFSSLLPLPQNLTYTYITSNYLGLGTDLAVPTSRQWLRVGSTASPPGIADTLFNTRSHLQQTSDVRSLIRGLDEPDRSDLAYGIEFNREFSSCITAQSFGGVNDTDYYRFVTFSGGTFRLNVSSVNAGVNSMAFVNESGTILTGKAYSGNSDSLEFTDHAGAYFVRLTGNSNQNVDQLFHNFSISFEALPRLQLTAAIEGMWNGIAAVSDTITVRLHNTTSPFEAVDSAEAVYSTSGLMHLEFFSALPGQYYVSTKHRNALETWSATPITLTGLTVFEYDFTSGSAQAYGGNMTLKSGKWCFYSGDVNGDGAIDATDVAATDNGAFIFASGYLATDLDGNNFTDATDVAIADNNASEFVGVLRP